MLGIVLQQPHLVPELNTLDNVFLASLVARKGDRGRARQLLDQVGLLGRAQQYPAVLSGGERSRAALARALMSEPALLLADEPTGNLDLASSQRMMDLLVQAARASGAAVLLATHNPLLAEQADRRLYLEDGKLAQLGAPS
jgi:ABC-type lipoprotein export system ATPase subunit